MPAVLTSAEAGSLIALLNPDASFERVAQHFAAAFAGEQRFRACCGAALFLEVGWGGGGCCLLWLVLLMVVLPSMVALPRDVKLLT